MKTDTEIRERLACVYRLLAASPLGSRQAEHWQMEIETLRWVLGEGS